MENNKQRSKLISRLWCVAKEYGVDSDNLHLLIMSYTKKDSITKLSDKQIFFIIGKIKGDGDQGIVVREEADFIKFDQEQYLHHLIVQIREKNNIQDMTAYLDEICTRSFKCKFSGIS